MEDGPHIIVGKELRLKVYKLASRFAKLVYRPSIGNCV